MAPPRNVVKIAVQMSDAIPQLIQLDQAKPLATVLKEVCDAWSLTHPEHYALQFADGHRKYITENNRLEIKNGSILCLSTAPVMFPSALSSPFLPLCSWFGGPSSLVPYLVGTQTITAPVVGVTFSNHIHLSSTAPGRI